jgi:hypothetical protein
MQPFLGRQVPRVPYGGDRLDVAGDRLLAHQIPTRARGQPSQCPAAAVHEVRGHGSDGRSVNGGQRREQRAGQGLLVTPVQQVEPVPQDEHHRHVRDLGRDGQVRVGEQDLQQRPGFSAVLPQAVRRSHRDVAVVGAHRRPAGAALQRVGELGEQAGVIGDAQQVKESLADGGILAPDRDLHERGDLGLTPPGAGLLAGGLGRQAGEQSHPRHVARTGIGLQKEPQQRPDRDVVLIHAAAEAGAAQEAPDRAPDPVAGLSRARPRLVDRRPGHVAGTLVLCPQHDFQQRLGGVRPLVVTVRGGAQRPDQARRRAPRVPPPPGTGAAGRPP